MYYFDFNLREFKTTEIELKVIAAAAKIGLSRMPKNGYKIPAATGIKAIVISSYYKLTSYSTLGVRDSSKIILPCSAGEQRLLAQAGFNAF